MKRLNDKRKSRQQTKDEVLRLIKTYPGIEQRSLPRLLGCSGNYASELVSELIKAKKVDKTFSNNVAHLRLVGAEIKPENAAIGKQWNACRSYRVPANQVLRYRDLSVPVPEDFRVDLEVANA